MISQQKQRLRETIRPLLANMTQQERDTASIKIRRQLLSLEKWQSASVIALFHPLLTEPDTVPPDFLGKTYCFPRVDGEHLHFHSVSSRQELITGKWGIREADPGLHPLATPGEISLIVVPGVAFDAEGHRLGRGKGFYDRALSKLSKDAVKIGICFACQMAEHVPCEPHDIKMDRVIFA